MREVFLLHGLNVTSITLIAIIHIFLMAHVLGIESTATWVREMSIANGLSLAGRITAVNNVNLGQCIVECYMDESCITAAVSESVHGCQLYGLDLEEHKHLTPQMDTVFYKCM